MLGSARPASLTAALEPVVIEQETVAGSSNAVLCLRKAKLSKSLKDIFKLLDAVCHMVDSAGGVTAVWRRNRSLSREVQARVQLYLGQWLSLLYDFRESRNTRSWSSIFFEYVVEDRQKRNHILDHKHVVRYEQVLQKYYDSTAHLEVTTVAGKLAELLDFFRTHTIDPYSCIIGHRASNTMAAAVSVPDPSLAESLGAQRSRKHPTLLQRTVAHLTDSASTTTSATAASASAAAGGGGSSSSSAAAVTAGEKPAASPVRQRRASILGRQRGSQSPANATTTAAATASSSSSAASKTASASMPVISGATASSSSSSSWSSSSYGAPATSPASIADAEGVLRLQLVSWCLSIADDQELAYRMRYEAAVLRGVLRLQRGDLALIRITNANTYRRTSGSDSDDSDSTDSDDEVASCSSSYGSGPGMVFARFTGQVTSTATPRAAATASATFGGTQLGLPLSPTLRTRAPSNSSRSTTTTSPTRAAAAVAAALRSPDSRVTTELSFWISPDEGSSISVSLLDVFPIPAALLNEALSYQCADFDKWVQHPDTPIIDDIQAFSETTVLQHLDSHGFKIGLLEAQATGTLSLIHCNKLEAMRRELRRLQTSISDRTSSLSGLNEYIDAQKAAYTRHMASLSTREIFHPTASTRADNIASLDPIRISLDTIARYESICSVAIADLEQKKEAILSGKQKQSLVTWWLDKITRDVDDFLVEQYVSLSLSLSLVCVWWTRLDLFLF